MRAVLSATLAKADFIARLQPILGDGLNVVDGEPAIVEAVPEADALFLTDFLYTEKVAAAVHAAATAGTHTVLALTKRSLMTVSSMFAVVTHTGVSNDDCTSVFDCVSFVVPLTSVDGTFSLARR